MSFNLFHLRHLLLSSLLVLSCTAAAQYRQHQPFRDYYTARAIGSERVYQRIYAGVGKHFIFGTADLHYVGPDSTGIMIDTSFTQRIRARHSFVLHAGTFFPVILLSDNSLIALNAEFLASYANLTIDSVFFHPKALYKGSKSAIMLGVPLSIDFKTGADVSLSNVPKPMFALGGGLLIGGTNSDLTGTEIPVKAIPFIKVEAGFVLGIAFKFRGTAYLGDASYINRTTYGVFSNDQLTTVTHSSYGYNLSLIIMPFSPAWRTEEWY